MAEPSTGRRWLKSSHSGQDNCVDVCFGTPGVVLVRDSKDPEGPVLAFTRTEWNAFAAGIRSGDFDGH
jgi:hypothetical protein